MKETSMPRPEKYSKYKRVRDFWQSDIVKSYEKAVDENNFSPTTTEVFRQLKESNLHYRTQDEIFDIFSYNSQNVNFKHESAEKWVCLLALDCYQIFGNFDLFLDMVETFGRPDVYQGGY